MKKLATDAMFKLEYDGKDQSKKSSQSAPDLDELEIQQSAWKDDYIVNYVLRKNLRVKLSTAIVRRSYKDCLCLFLRFLYCRLSSLAKQT
jgi:hypothetical protein